MNPAEHDTRKPFPLGNGDIPPGFVMATLESLPSNCWVMSGDKWHPCMGYSKWSNIVKYSRVIEKVIDTKTGTLSIRYTIADLVSDCIALDTELSELRRELLMVGDYAKKSITIPNRSHPRNQTRNPFHHPRQTRTIQKGLDMKVRIIQDELIIPEGYRRAINGDDLKRCLVFNWGAEYWVPCPVQCTPDVSKLQTMGRVIFRLFDLRSEKLLIERKDISEKVIKLERFIYRPEFEKEIEAGERARLGEQLQVMKRLEILLNYRIEYAKQKGE